MLTQAGRKLITKTKGQSRLQKLWTETAFTIYFRLHSLPTHLVSTLNLTEDATMALHRYNLAVKIARKAILESYKENKRNYKRD